MNEEIAETLSAEDCPIVVDTCDVTALGDTWRQHRAVCNRIDGVDAPQIETVAVRAEAVSVQARNLLIVAGQPDCRFKMEIDGVSQPNLRKVVLTFEVGQQPLVEMVRVIK